MTSLLGTSILWWLHAFLSGWLNVMTLQTRNSTLFGALNTINWVWPWIFPHLVKSSLIWFLISERLFRHFQKRLQRCNLLLLAIVSFKCAHYWSTIPIGRSSTSIPSHHCTIAISFLGQTRYPNHYCFPGYSCQTSGCGWLGQIEKGFKILANNILPISYSFCRFSNKYCLVRWCLAPNTWQL